MKRRGAGTEVSYSPKISVRESARAAPAGSIIIAMGTFRDSLGDQPERPDDASDETPEKSPEVPEQVPEQAPEGKPEFPEQPPAADEAQFSEVDDAQFSEAEEAQVEDVSPESEKVDTSSSPNWRKLVAGAVIVLAVLALVVVALGKGDQDSTTTPTTPSEPAKKKPAKTKTKPAKTKPAKTDPKNSLGLPTAAEKAEAKKLLDRAEKFIKKSDHPAEGKRGVLVNDSKKFASIMQNELGVKVITEGDPEPGQLFIALERRVGLFIMTTTAGKIRMPIIKKVKIINIGIGARN